MKFFFNDIEFDKQLQHTVSYAPYGGADVTECFACAARCKEGDFESWFEEWNSLAQSVEANGNYSLNHGHLISAKDCYLRASNYYRTSMYFKYDKNSTTLENAWEKQYEAFNKALSLFDIPIITAEIPYENQSIPAYLFFPDDSQTPKPTIIIHLGYEGTCQEGYFAMGCAALQRKYNVLLLDGPGQGEMLIKRQTSMRYDWEKVVTPIVDWLQGIDLVDESRIALYGSHWGSLLATRAAAFEHRITALIATPGMFNPLEPLIKLVPVIDRFIETGDDTLISDFLKYIEYDKMLSFNFRSKAWIHGVKTPQELFLEWDKYHLINIADHIICPTFIGDNLQNVHTKGQAKQLFTHLKCPKKYMLFRDDLSSAQTDHNTTGSLLYFHQRIFDWLDDCLQNTNLPPVIEM